RWGKTLDTGWDAWDVEIYCHPWTVVQVCTAQEDHGSGRHLIRVRYRLRPSGYMDLMASAGGVGVLVAAYLLAWPVALASGLLLATCLVLWWRGTCRATHALAVFDALAQHLGLVRCDSSSRS